MNPRKGLKREGMRSYRVSGPEGELLIDRAPEMRRFFVRRPEWPNGFYSVCERRLTDARAYAESAVGIGDDGYPYPDVPKCLRRWKPKARIA
jgi:hypothetical protein